jgi:mannosyltransferase
MGKNTRIILILGLALILRLVNLNQSFWLDEGCQMVMSAKSLAFQWFGRANDFQPPLYYFLTHYWLQLGKSEWFLRLPSVFFGVATVYLVYLLGKKLFNEKLGLIAAFFLAIAPYHLYYSQEARMYSLLVFLATASMLFLIERKWLAYILATAAMFYTHYASFFLIFPQIVWVFFWQRRRLKSFLESLFFSFFLYLPWLPQLFKQLGAGSNLTSLLPAWQGVASLPVVKALPLTFIKFSLGRISFLDKRIYALIAGLVAIIFGFLFYQSLKKLTQEKVFLLAWLILPLLLALTVSIFIPLYQPFRLLFTIIPFYLLLALGVISLKKKWQPLAIALVLLISLSGLFLYYLNPSFQRENWREAVAFIESQESERTVALFEFSEPFAPYQWYSRGRVKAVGILPGVKANPEMVNKKLAEATKEKENVFLFEYLTDLTDLEHLVGGWLEENGFSKKEIKDFSGVGFVYNYQRK